MDGGKEGQGGEAGMHIGGASERGGARGRSRARKWFAGTGAPPDLGVSHAGRDREERVNDIVAVADPGQALALERAAAVLLHRERVRQGLEGVVRVREAIDDRDARLGSKLLDGRVLEHASENAAVEPAEHAGSGAQGLVRAKLCARAEAWGTGCECGGEGGETGLMPSGAA